MNKPFNSCFASDLEAFIQKKRDVGFLYDTAEHVLHQFDSFCAEHQVDKPMITKDLVSDWLASFEKCCAVTSAGKVSVIRQFSMYLLSVEKPAYIPSQKHQGKHRQIHVLSDAEITAFFEQVDQYAPEIEIPSFRRLALEYRIIFRMLLCCGMRVSEARKLKKEDVDLHTGILIIKNSKGRKDRIVYLPLK